MRKNRTRFNRSTLMVLALLALMILTVFIARSVLLPKKQVSEPEKPKVYDIATRKIMPEHYDPKVDQVVIDFNTYDAISVEKLIFFIQTRIINGELPYRIEDPSGNIVHRGVFKTGNDEMEQVFDFMKGTWKWIGETTGEDEGAIRIEVTDRMQDSDRIWIEEEKPDVEVEPDK